MRIRDYYIATLRKSSTNSDTDTVVFATDNLSDVYLYCYKNDRPILFLNKVGSNTYINFDRKDRIDIPSKY